MALTKHEQWKAMSDEEKFIALTTAELQRDNAVLLLKEAVGRGAAERQQEIVDGLVQRRSCPNCGGRGEVPDTDPYRERTQNITCPTCGGSKYVQRRVA